MVKALVNLCKINLAFAQGRASLAKSAQITLENMETSGQVLHTSDWGPWVQIQALAAGDASQDFVRGACR